MAKLEEKKKRVKWLEESFTNSPASFMVDYRGLKVDELTELRRKLRESKAQFRVVKNTLARRGAEGVKLKQLGSFFVGPTGVVFAQDEPVMPAKMLKEFMDEHPNLKIKGGILAQDVLDSQRVVSLANLPDRNSLMAQFLSQINSPLVQFMGGLISPVQNFMLVVNSIMSEKKEGGPSMATNQKTQQKTEGQKENRKETIIKAIEQMNILELSELVKELEERFGVKAAAPQVAAAGAPAKEKEAEEEKAEFDVVLAEIGSKKIQVIKEVRKLTSLGLKEAKDLVESAPKPIKEAASKEEAQKIKQTLENVGAKVELK